MLTLRVPIQLPNSLRPRTVLLVSADAEWRASVEGGLTSAGYHVISVRHVGQALVESSRYPSVDLVVAEGEFGRGGLPPRIFEDHPNLRVLHLPKRPEIDELLRSIATALK